jgi:hypothetical protein
LLKKKKRLSVLERSRESERSSPVAQRRGALQLWQFLVALLDDPNNASCIVWTGRGLEFKLVEPEEVIFFFFFYRFISMGMLYRLDV